jgi:hypothetical protein
VENRVRNLTKFTAFGINIVTVFAVPDPQKERLKSDESAVSHAAYA